MSTIAIQYGQTALIDPQIEYADSGWVIDGQYATHYPCFAGNMDYTPTLPFIDGKQYDFTYVVDGYNSGSVKLKFGGVDGTSHSANGTFTDTFEYSDGDILQFYSDGSLRVTLLSIAEHLEAVVQNATTFAFHEPTNKWVENYSWAPEAMINFGKRFFTLINGQLWEHETNPIAGNFYGTKYPAQITFVLNKEYEKDKLWQNLRMDAKGAWYAPVVTTPATNQFPRGMATRIKKNNVALIDGKLWADVMRDINDPNFAGQPAVEVVYKGRQMQGGVLEVTLECNDITQSEIISAEFYYTDTERSL